MLEGNDPEREIVLPQEVRDYQLAKRFGWTHDQIRESPAVWLDWMLAIDGIASGKV